MKKYPFLLMIVSLLWACEKRILLDTEFPHAEERVFCEVVGFVNLGFFGTVTQVQEVTTDIIDHQNLKVIIREENSIIFEETLTLPALFFSYPVKNDINYSIEILYKNQTIKSNQSKMASPPLFIENLIVENNFIDSLGFEVATIAFDFTSPPNTNETLYYTYQIELSPDNPSTMLDPYGNNPADTVSITSLNFIEKRIANMTNHTFAHVGLLSIDKPFFQYLKNIKQLDIIPNDNIEGHHGNLDGGIGYFGVVNYDLEVVEF